MNRLNATLLAGVLGFAAVAGYQVYAAGQGQMDDQGKMGQGMMGSDLEMPMMNSARGRQLFASKGCVVCHSVNGVGGEDAPALDAGTMKAHMNPFDFAAKMWRGAEPMIEMQREELGGQIELSGEDLADIVAFAHDAAEQSKFSEADIPPKIKELMEHMEDEEHHEDDAMHKSD